MIFDIIKWLHLCTVWEKKYDLAADGCRDIIPVVAIKELGVGSKEAMAR